jgi:hypothetical protein
MMAKRAGTVSRMWLHPPTSGIQRALQRQHSDTKAIYKQSLTDRPIVPRRIAHS